MSPLLLQHWTWADGLALLWMLVLWFVYGRFADRLPPDDVKPANLNQMMHHLRRAWMRRMIDRHDRIVDSSLTGHSVNSTTFFASTSLLAVGACLGLLNASDRAVEVVQTLSFGHAGTRQLWEIKLAGLTVVFVYAFFKFGWAYRLFNYCAILIGATPEGDRRTSDEAKAMAERAARMNTIAAAHFNRGQRAFFFALGYLGWFAGPVVFMIATTAVFAVLYRRQFHSESRQAVI